MAIPVVFWTPCKVSHSNFPGSENGKKWKSETMAGTAGSVHCDCKKIRSGHVEIFPKLLDFFVGLTKNVDGCFREWQLTGQCIWCAFYS